MSAMQPSTTSDPRQETVSRQRDVRPRVGLVLGAGGIRGCAHGGAISVLREAEVPVDLVVGVSIGAMFGLGVAAGLPTEYIAGVAREATSLDIIRFYAG